MGKIALALKVLVLSYGAPEAFEIKQNVIAKVREAVLYREREVI